jgi:hypothetical protein
LIDLGLLDREEVSPTTSLHLLAEVALVTLTAQLRTGTASGPKGHCGKASLATALRPSAAEATVGTGRYSVEPASNDLARLIRLTGLRRSSPSCAKVADRRPPSHGGLAIATNSRSGTSVANPMKP